MSSPTMGEGALSLWQATARPSPAYPTLRGEHRADVVIIGGGYTGLSTAYHVSKGGDEPLVLEAKTVGWGASGRNGGYASTRLRASLPAIMRVHGREPARRLYNLGREAVDYVEGLIETCGIDGSDFHRHGHITAAVNEFALRKLRANAEWLAAEFGDSSTRILGREEAAKELGSPVFAGGSLNEADAGLHPLNFARGLARKCTASGIALFERSPAIKVASGARGVIVETQEGLVRADKVVFATNAYSDTTGATGDLPRRVIPFRSSAIATVPLLDVLKSEILPSRRMGSDSKRVLRWFRIVDERLVFGGRGAFGSDEDSDAGYQRLRRNMVEIFPQLRDVAIEFQWSGLVAMTFDFLPHIGRIGDRAYYALGYNGTGVALSNLLGKHLAALVRGEPIDVGLLASERFRPIPFHFLKAPAVRAATAWFQLLDTLDTLKQRV